MAEVHKLKVSIDGRAITGITNLMVQQAIFGHHHFSFTFPLNSIIDPESNDAFRVLYDFSGKGVVIQWSTHSFMNQNSDDESCVFKGLIDEVSLEGGVTAHATVVVKGHSPTLSLDGAPLTRSFFEQKVDDIFNKVVSEAIGGKTIVNNSFKGKIAYSVQLEESSFNYLARLCFDIGEWFYYDGEAMCLGIKSKMTTHKLGRDRIFDLDFVFKIPPPSPALRSGDYMRFEQVEQPRQKPDSEDGLIKHAVQVSDRLYPGNQRSFIHLPARDPGNKAQMNGEEFKAFAESVGNTTHGESAVLRGSSDFGSLRVGDSITLSGLAYAGDYIITSVTHMSGGNRNYTNHFEAIPKGSLIPPAFARKRKLLSTATAQVTNNNDPEKLGRVKVQFPWDPQGETPWLRVLTAHAGDDRGMYFIPEVGDEVMAGFEMGLPEYPYVIGSLYNGKNKFKDAYEKSNNYKSIKTKGGNEIRFDDDGTTIQIRNGKNLLEITTKDAGIITLHTDGEIALAAKKNISIDAGGDISIKAGGKLSIKSSGAGELTSDNNLTVGAGKNLELEAKANAKMKGGANTNIEGVQTVVEGKMKAEISASAVTVVKGGIVKIN